MLTIHIETDLQTFLGTIMSRSMRTPTVWILCYVYLQISLRHQCRLIRADTFLIHETENPREAKRVSLN